MKRQLGHQFLFFLLLGLLNASAHAVDPERDLKGVASPTDGRIKPVQFILSVYRDNGEGRDRAAATQMSGNTGTESMRVGDGQAVFMGTAQEIPIPVVTAAKGQNEANLKAVSYKKLESGLELRPHLMGRVVQLEIVDKKETWNDQTKTIDVQNSHAVVVLPLDKWSKVRGTLDDNQDIEDIYDTNREKTEDLWVRVELAPN